MADVPAKNDFEVLPELTKENTLKISTHQAILLLYRQRLEAVFELFNAKIQKLKQTQCEILKSFFTEVNIEGQPA